MKNQLVAAKVARIVRLLMLPVFMAAALGSAPQGTVHAVGSTITVDTLDGGLVDGGGSGDCSLAEAIVNANLDGTGTPYADCVNGSADDTIVFSVSGTILLTDRLPTIDDPENEATSIDGSDDIVIDGDSLYEVIHINSPAVLKDLVIQNAYDQFSGGAIWVQPDGDLTVEQVLFYNNHAGGTGAAIDNTGVLTVNRSTFTSNSVGFYGGAIYNSASGIATIANSTFYNNQSESTEIGGGAIASNATLTLLSSTVSHSNSASGGAVHMIAGTFTVINSILANSTTGTDCSEDSGMSMSVSYSLVETDGCGLTDGVDGNIIGQDPKLGSLVNVPAYFLLHPTSPAIDAGNSAQQYGAFDQPGFDRLVDIPWAADTGDDDGTGTVIDMGSYEATIYCPGGTRLYVDAGATGAALGTSWADAFPDLQMALATVAECGTPTEIWVAAGLYKPDGGLPDSVEATFSIPPGTSLYGGFDGTETNLSEQDWVANVTVLSGDVDDDDDTDADGVVLQPIDQNGTNAIHVVTMDGTAGTTITNTTVLDGFVITGASATGSGGWNGIGGGLICHGGGAGNECSPTLADLHFRGNIGGNAAAALLLRGNAGGISSPIMTNVSFFYNSAPNGSAMVAYGYGGTSSPSLTDGYFAYNSGTGQGGALLLEGTNGVSSADLEDVVFLSNQATGKGGAVYCDGSGGECSPSLTNVTFESNTSAQDGGAMYNDGTSGSSNPIYVNVTFKGNSANGAGGALYNNGSSNGESSPDIHNSTFYGNGVGTVGDGTEDGGAMYNNADGGVSSPTLIHVTISGNEANVAGGGIFNSAQSAGNSSGWVVNSIVYGNTASAGAQIQNALGTPTILSSAIQDSFPGSVWDSSLGTDGGGNTAGDPMLAALADNGGLTETMALLAGSSAIDTADDDECLAVTDDQRGGRRPQGTHCDMGAYEFIVADTIGINGSGTFYLRDANASGPADNTFGFGWDGPTPLVGDWDGDGVSTVGIDDGGWFFLRNSNSAGAADLIYQYGWAGATPLIGDWDGDGTDTVGLYSGGWFFLRNSNSAGPADLVFSFGWNGPTPLVGDWDGDGVDTVGIYDAGWFFLRNSNSAGPADMTFNFGWAGPTPMAGDWDGDGVTTVGITSVGTFFLRNSNSAGPADVTFNYGWAGAAPLAGTWDQLP